jgi:hypothetical protein
MRLNPIGTSAKCHSDERSEEESLVKDQNKFSSMKLINRQISELNRTV